MKRMIERHSGEWRKLSEEDVNESIPSVAVDMVLI
jgi:hypothetical protein